ncbi:MAG: DUF368 domain-containing protein [Defluviitaleaceae bacterium]|nr:DUF368 domain-containing protein [Defluviitaleaceae bacterium]MCL2837315.1 DUF368 domain-containing protein [Defluviitaleaceae bacterium]
MIKYFKTFINGAAFGITQIVPGVSGGTIAIMMGFYDRLIETVNYFTKDYRKHSRFLIPFLMGVAFGILAFSEIITYLLTNFSMPTMLFFIGLIIGIIPHMYKKIKKPGIMLKPGEITLIAVPIAALIIISSLRNETAALPAEIIGSIGLPYMAFIFIAGVIAAAGLLAPGISGSLLLLLMGIYHVITYSVSSVRHLLADITNAALWADICKVMIPFAIGVIIGGLSMARLIEKLLKNYTRIINPIILGLLLGSVYSLFNQPVVFQSGTSVIAVIIGVFMFLLGSVLSFIMGKKRL